MEKPLTARKRQALEMRSRIQNVALAHIPPAQASLILSLESVFGVLFSCLLSASFLLLAVGTIRLLVAKGGIL